MKNILLKFSALLLGLIAFSAFSSTVSAANCTTAQNNFCNGFKAPVSQVNYNCNILPNATTFECQAYYNPGGAACSPSLTNSGQSITNNPGTNSPTFCGYIGNISVSVAGSTPVPTTGTGTNPTTSTGNTGSTGSSGSKNIIDNPTPGIGDFGDLLNKFFGFIPVALGLALLGYFIFGGFTVMTAGADDQKKATGFKILTNAIIGAVIIILSVSIIIFFQALIGRTFI